MYSYPRGTLRLLLRTHHCYCYRSNTCFVLVYPAVTLCLRLQHYKVTWTPQHPHPTQQSGHCHLLSACCYLQAIAITITPPNNTSQSFWDRSMTTLTLDTVSPYPNYHNTTTTTATMKKSPLTPSTITPPSINRQHSYNSTSTSTRPSLSPFSLRSTSTDARNILSQVASRAASPRRSNTTPSGSPLNTPAPESPTSTMERRRSWEDCVHQRDGYISFPDFDEINADASGR